ncbi:MAG: VWA domain-containing protein [Pirellulaceae bacterium]|nr:VWA domain-containing protein [Pirellulaceae bacterium]
MDAAAGQLDLLRPWFLLGLLAIPLLVAGWWISLVDFPRWQRVASLLVRCVIAGLLVLALAGLVLRTPAARQFVLLAVDDSLSVGQSGREQVAEYLRQVAELAGRNEVRYLRFASQPDRLVDRWEPPADIAAASETRGDLPAGATEPAVTALPSAEHDQWRMSTNLAAAIELATASIPPVYAGQLVLLSDGNETAGDALRAASSGGIPVSVVPLPGRDEPEVQVSAVHVPVQVRQGEPFFVEVVIDSNHDDEGWIELFRGPHKLTGGEPEAPRPIQRGENRFRFAESATDQRLLEYTARIRGFQDRLLDNNSATGLVFTTGPPRVLLLDDEPRTGRELQWALAEQQIVVDVRPPNAAPRTLAELQNYEAVILSNVPATALSLPQMELLRAFVRDLGGGLLILGGDQSFGLGGYYRTPLDEVLPVHCDVEKDQEKPSLAMVLILDKSGSMGGLKLELAKDASRGAVELLASGDQVGVIAFDGASYWVSPLRDAADKLGIGQRINTIQASGGTSIYPALDDALRALEATVARLKHVILLTDGHSSPGDFENLTRRLAAARVTVSTVAVGEDADQNLLQTIARLGNGRYYYCDDPRAVPQIFAKETVAAGRSSLNEEPFLPQVVRATQVLSGIDWDTAPPLLGYVATRPKPTSELILATETGQPLLAWWRYGLGVAVAFTSDAKSRWAAEWLSWPDFGPFWAQVVRHAMRDQQQQGVEVRITQADSELEVWLDSIASDGQFRNQVPGSVTLIDPRLERTEYPLAQVAPGGYAARFPRPEPGTYHLELVQQLPGSEVFRKTRGLVVGYPDELRLRPTNERLLRAVAEVSGGRYNPAPGELFAAPAAPARQAQPLWPWLLSLALVLFVADVALRRVVAVS